MSGSDSREKSLSEGAGQEASKKNAAWISGCPPNTGFDEKDLNAGLHQGRNGEDKRKRAGKHHPAPKGRKTGSAAHNPSP